MDVRTLPDGEPAGVAGRPIIGNSGRSFKIFITLRIAAGVQCLHDETIRRHGGSTGIRDRALLESAVAMPRAPFGGAWLHDSIEAMAAAYLFHLCQYHPFVDGNKRTATAASLVFLRMNGYRLRLTQDDVVELALRVAPGELSKADIAGFLHTRVERE